MATLVTRELVVTYGSLTVGDSNRKIEDLEVTKAFRKANVTLVFVVGGYSSAANFVTAVQACDAEFRKPRQALTVTIGGSTLYSFSQTANTGMDGEPEITKMMDEASTGRSCRFTVRMTFDLPADNTSSDGLQESKVDVAYSDSRRKTITITGLYTALSSNAARAQYEASFAAYASAVTTAIGGTYELKDRNAATNYTNKKCEFRHVYREVIYSQGGANVDDSGIIEQVFTMRRSQEFMGDYDQNAAGNGGSFADFFGGRPSLFDQILGGVQKVISVEANWVASIDKTVTQDLSAKWDTVKPWVVSQIQAKFGTGVVVVIDSKPQFDYDNNTIAATVVAEVIAGNSLLSIVRTESVKWTTGSVVIGAFDGRPLGGYPFQGPGKLLQTVEERSVFGGNLALAVPSLSPSEIGGFGRLQVTMIESDGSVTPKTVGEVGYTTVITEVYKMAVFQAFHEPQVTRSPITG